MSSFRLTFVAVVLSLLLLTACGGSKQAKVAVPSPPPISEPETRAETAQAEVPDVPEPPPKRRPAKEDKADEEAPIRIPENTKPLLVETGLASWYGAPYHHRRSSNGEVYDMHALTAAHRTLPLGSIVRVTNVKTGHAAVVRITDRGPFVPGRILDLSQAAAKKTDVWAAGVTSVRMEVLSTPVPLNSGGRWAVQIGGFEKEHAADKLADHLSHRYQTAKVLCFSSPVGAWWVRVRVQDDDRKRAEQVARDTRTSEGDIFLVRLD
jgi:peptidoglycan lytic transglycosylase